MFYEIEHSPSADYFAIEKNKNFSFPEHLHHCFEVIVVTSGEMTVGAGSRKYDLKKGEAVFVFPNQVHSLATPRKSSHFLILFSPNLVSTFSRLISDKTPEDNFFKPSTEWIQRALNVRDTSDIVEKKALLYSVCSDFHKNAVYINSTNDTNLLIHHIFGFVEQHYTDDCSLSQLSKCTGYEYTYLSRYFKKIVGLSYNDYVNQYRTSKACYLLSNSEKSILEISSECGFNSLRSFNRNFKEKNGLAPAEYRKSIASK